MGSATSSSTIWPLVEWATELVTLLHLPYGYNALASRKECASP